MAKGKKSAIDMDIFCSAADAMKAQQQKTVLPVSPSIDYRLGGGIIEGSMVLVRGRPKTGKSLTSMEITVNALKQGRWVMYFDTENRLTASKYFVIDGFDILGHPRFLLMNAESNKTGEFISGEKMYAQIIQMMKTPKYKGAVYIIDSLSNVLTQDLIDDPIVTSQRRDQTPKLNADFCKKVTPFMRASNSILVGIQHMQKSMDPNLHGKLLPIGGDRLEYTADIVLECKHGPLDLDGNNVSRGHDKGAEPSEGLLIRYDLPYNKLLAPYVAKDQDEKILNYYRFGKGCWKAREMLSVFIELGFVMKGGAWMTFITEKFTDKVQGAEKAADLIEENFEYFDGLVQNYYNETYGVNYAYEPIEDEE